MIGYSVLKDIFNGNTLLHDAVLYENKNNLEKILNKVDKSIIDKKNSDEDLFWKKQDRHYTSNFLTIASSLCLSSLPEGAAGICSIMITCEGLL